MAAGRIYGDVECRVVARTWPNGRARAGRTGEPIPVRRDHSMAANSGDARELTSARPCGHDELSTYGHPVVPPQRDSYEQSIKLG
jgi:hypothetical protein